MNPMTLPNIWEISPEAFGGIRAAVRGCTAELAIKAQERDERLPLKISNGLAVIPIRGVMMKNADIWTMLMGGTSTRMAKRAVDAAAADETVKTILLVIDSPGGSVDGLAELSDAVFAARQSKRVIAQVDGTMASAAFHVASQADKIFAGRMDVIGSIGTLLVVQDWSKAFEEAGVEVNVFKTGFFKGAGVMGSEVTDEQKAEFQRIVDEFFADFVAVVARGRGISKAEVMKSATGQVWLAADAKARGLIDGIKTVDETIARFSGPSRREQRAQKFRDRTQRTRG